MKKEYMYCCFGLIISIYEFVSIGMHVFVFKFCKNLNTFLLKRSVLKVTSYELEVNVILNTITASNVKNRKRVLLTYLDVFFSSLTSLFFFFNTKKKQKLVIKFVTIKKYRKT